MITPVDETLRTEAKRFHLRFACPDCVSFAPADPLDDRAREGHCSLGYPNEMHEDADLEGRAEVIFCKAFELR